MKKFFKAGLITVIVLLVLIQFYPRAKNNLQGSEAMHLGTRYPIPGNVEQLLKAACYDCHSNHTVYPWYYNVQPLAWWLDDHINHGKKELNFSTFASYNLAKQYHKLEEVEELVGEKAMPLSSYTLIHTKADLSPEQRKTIVDWSANVRAAMRARYPADSLVRKKRG